MNRSGDDRGGWSTDHECSDSHCRDGRVRWSWRTRLWTLARRFAWWATGDNWLSQGLWDEEILSMARDRRVILIGGHQ